jgi:hypothetical protein
MFRHSLRSQGKHVQIRSRLLGAVMLLALVAQPIGAVPVLAQGATAAAAAGTISGTITDASGTPLAGATVTISGPQTLSATTDSLGHYSIAAPPGIYRLLVRAPGFAESVEEGITVAATATTLDASLSRPTLSSLQTIGSVRTSANGGGPAFNTSAAAQETIGQSTFENQGDISVRNILDETPGIVDSVSNGSANAGVRGAITYPTIRGGLSYETASLIDGHPVSVGKYGDYVTTFLNRYLFQSVELSKGPGSLPPEINRSVNGTVNFRTWDPTATLTGNAEFGVDGFGGKFSNFRLSDTVLNNKLGFVIDYATEGTPGAAGGNNPSAFAANLSDVSYTNSQGVPVAVSPVTKIIAPGALNSYTSLATNTVACCLSMPTNYLNHSELAKVRFNFSDVTTFTGTLIDSQTYSSQNGNTNNLYQTAFNPTIPNATVPSGNINTFYPYNDAFAQDYEENNEPIFEAEFRTQIKNDNLLMRFYSASISRLQTNSDQSNTPFTQPVELYGTTASGAPLNGLDQYGQPYIATITSPLYQSQEQDNLTGYSFEYDHALGGSGDYLTFSADQNYSATHVYTPGEADNSSTSNIPSGSQQNIGTYSLRGNFALGPKLSLVAGYYYSRYDTHFATFNTTGTATTFSFSDNVNYHSDDRIGLVFRPDPSTSVRFAAGSATVAPFLGILSGTVGTPTICSASSCPSGYQPGSVYVNSVGGLNIQPETSFGYDLGFDKKLRADTVLAGDVYLTDLHNQFLKTVYLNGLFAGPQGVLPLATTAYSNLADARYEGIEMHLNKKPSDGFGYAVQGALLRGYPYNVPSSIYQYNSSGVATTNQTVVSGVNFGPYSVLSSGGSAIPYAQGYAELNYQLHQGWYGNIGVIYFGPNNTFNEPAFEVTRATLRVPLGSRSTYLQFAVDNLFNINPEIFDVNSGGVGAVAIGNAYETTQLKGYGPRNIHLVLAHNFR